MKEPFSTFLFAGLVLLAISLPLIFKKIPMNRFYGVRTCQAFKNPEAWYSINQYGGLLFLKFSILLIILSLLSQIIPQNYSGLYYFLLVAFVVIALVIIIGLVFRYSKRY